VDPKLAIAAAAMVKVMPANDCSNVFTGWYSVAWEAKQREKDIARETIRFDDSW